MQNLNSTRDRVLRTLLDRQHCTINELAEAVEINPISIRHHITRLQADGLVDSHEERHGVGRPRRLYYLTEQGVERFPTRYVRMSNRLIGQVKQHLPQPLVEKLFVQMAQDLLSEETDRAKLAGMNFEERLELVKELLADEGFSIEWEKDNEAYHIREVNCPYLQLGQQHPEICAMDQTVISSVLNVPAEKVRCILNGDALCTYVIPFSVLENPS